MKTLFVSGSDTNVGKTWVAGAIAQYLSSRGNSVQVVKPIESGVSEYSESDVGQILDRCSNPLVTGYTLRSFSLPMAPLAAAEHEGDVLEFSDTESSIEKLPSDIDWRIVEGAGSIATPISSDGRDWSDLALAMGVRAVVLVVEDRVGAIGQARMVYDYSKSKNLNCGLWLNEIRTQDPLGKKGTLKGIQDLGIPVWGSSSRGQCEVEFLKEGWL